MGAEGKVNSRPSSKQLEDRLRCTMTGCAIQCHTIPYDTMQDWFVQARPVEMEDCEDWAVTAGLVYLTALWSSRGQRIYAYKHAYLLPPLPPFSPLAFPPVSSLVCFPLLSQIPKPNVACHSCGAYPGQIACPACAGIISAGLPPQEAAREFRI